MENTEFSHYSVLKNEVIDSLSIVPNGVYVDCTAGGGGHSFAIASKLNQEGKLFAIDRDEDAIKAAGNRLSPFGNCVTMVKSNFTEAVSVLKSRGITAIDGALIDLGVSSYQLDTAERGFSYMHDAPLDMRMDREQALTAYEVVNTYSEGELKKILFTYGEEKFAPKIASMIVRRRAEKPIETTMELAQLIKNAMPAKAPYNVAMPAAAASESAEAAGESASSSEASAESASASSASGN